MRVSSLTITVALLAAAALIAAVPGVASAHLSKKAQVEDADWDAASDTESVYTADEAVPGAHEGDFLKSNENNSGASGVFEGDDEEQVWVPDDLGPPPSADTSVFSDIYCPPRPAPEEVHINKAYPFPSAFMVGIQRSSTTIMFDWLSLSPSSALPSCFKNKCGGLKEIKYFTRESGEQDKFSPESLRTYFNNLLLDVPENFPVHDFTKSRIDATITLMSHPQLLPNVREAFPWAKVFLHLREPIANMQSMVLHLQHKYEHDTHHTQEMWRRDWEHMYENMHKKDFGPALASVLRNWGCDTHVVLYEQLRQDPAAAYHSTCAHLNMFPGSIINWDRKLPVYTEDASGAPIEIYRAMVDYFEPYRLAVEAMLGRPTGWDCIHRAVLRECEASTSVPKLCDVRHVPPECVPKVPFPVRAGAFDKAGREFGWTFPELEEWRALNKADFF